MSQGDTFSKAGGGFFPLQRLDRAQTAFLVMVNLVDLVRSLKWNKGKQNSAHKIASAIRYYRMAEARLSIPFTEAEKMGLH